MVLYAPLAKNSSNQVRLSQNDDRADTRSHKYRRLRERPWHSPPHWEFAGLLQFMISGACYEHEHIIGATPERMAKCEGALLDACEHFSAKIYAWCVLPNHYHVLVQTERLRELRPSWENFTAGRPLSGMAKTSGGDVKCGTTAWTAASNHMAISGPV